MKLKLLNTVIQGKKLKNFPYMKSEESEKYIW